MRDVRMSHADLRNADFRALVFEMGDGTKRSSKCDLEGSNLRYTNCAGARFNGSSFRFSDLSYADFTGCDLSGADFTGARLDGVIFEGVTVADVICDEDAPEVLKKSPSAAE
jgi:uncharacterized protein YjbI with pentapeptide repeats